MKRRENAPGAIRQRRVADAKLLRCCMLVVVSKAAITRSIQRIFSLTAKPTMSVARILLHS